MSPSAVTRAIQRLEEDLGQPPFQRSKRSVTLTRAGEMFRDHARGPPPARARDRGRSRRRGQVAAHARLQEALATETQTPTGELRIACTVTACHSVLPKLLARCRERYPAIHL